MSHIDESAEGGCENELGLLRIDQEKCKEVLNTIFLLNVFISKSTKKDKMSCLQIQRVDISPFSDHFKEEVNFCIS